MGVSSFLHAPLTNETNKTYGTIKKTGGAIEAKPTINYNDATIYSDNRLKKKNTSFKDGLITLTVDYANKEVLSPLIGRTMTTEQFTTESGAIIPVVKHISNSSNKPIPVGFGYVVQDFDVDGNKDKYVVRFFYKVEFKPYTQDAKTKAGVVEYVPSTLEGTIYELSNGDWCEEEDFDSETVAVEYLYKLLGGSYASETRLNSLVIGTLLLTPGFDMNTIVYLADTTEATATITAEAVSENAVVVITVGGVAVTNGETATFDAGINEVIVTVTNGTGSKLYTVFVTHTA